MCCEHYRVQNLKYFWHRFCMADLAVFLLVILLFCFFYYVWTISISILYAHVHPFEISYTAVAVVADEICCVVVGVAC